MLEKQKTPIQGGVWNPEGARKPRGAFVIHRMAKARRKMRLRIGKNRLQVKKKKTGGLTGQENKLYFMSPKDQNVGNLERKFNEGSRNGPNASFEEGQMKRKGDYLVLKRGGKHGPKKKRAQTKKRETGRKHLNPEGVVIQFVYSLSQGRKKRFGKEKKFTFAHSKLLRGDERGKPLFCAGKVYFSGE